MFVKLCGLRTLDDARTAIEVGADALGFILAESRRQVSDEFVTSVRDEIINPPTIVGVTVNASPELITELISKARLDMVQLSGNEPPSILDNIDFPIIKALKFRSGTAIDDAVRVVESWFAHRNRPEIVILEGHQVGSHGGTGTIADWKLAAEIAVRYPIVLAGGLTPDNVAEAIARVQPVGVDTSSGTETEGVKDPVKMRLFVERARKAFADL